METTRFLEVLGDDYRRLLGVAAGDLTVTVPTCPDWTLADLVEHVSMVYLHKVATMRLGTFPSPWPPEDLPPEAPADRLARAYAELTAEFARHTPETAVQTWYEPDQTVGFWIRRMVHESVIHRVDGELAAGLPPTEVPDDVALDGIDENLQAFLAYQVGRWPEEFAAALADCGGETLLVSAGGRGWLVRLRPGTVTVEAAESDADADATISGPPSGVLLWLWRRTDDGAVRLSGKASVSGKLRDLQRIATQ
ncbi:maleylpyruvate isomerase family mycothiol-dependent enzyme [Hamadaea sp. NPDC051192]|uniref:maleylpyruvate isomerase family mycothiol-dependent enzyme n=1 Tax=Hamadaea sp. NPDC051192 TaxID=3154940 RepID=UPI00342CFC4D